jgi:hypothetical protein
MSGWTAPVTAGGGTRPTITVKPTSRADTGAAALEYSGLSTVADATVVDQMAHTSGKTSGAASVSSGATAATTAANELALGLYADSGFGDTLSSGSGYTSRVNVSNTGDMELLAEDQVVGAGATPNASAGTGASTYWLMATIVLKASTGLGAADRLTAHRRAIHHRKLTHHPKLTHHRKVTRHRKVNHHRDRRGGGHHTRVYGSPSLRRAAAIAASASSRFVFIALLKHLSLGLLCHHGGSAALGQGARLIPGWPDWWWWHKPKSV